MIWLIVPFSRPHLFGNVLDNFNRLSLPEKRLLLVCNGAARGFVGTGVTVIESDDGVAEPMNAGLEFARANGKSKDWFCKFDDDDLYLEGYLDGVLEAQAKGAKFGGQLAAWMKTKDDQLWFIDGPQETWSSEGAHGPTLFGSIDCIDFPHVDRWGEDALWYRGMAAEFGPGWLTSARDFCWMRHKNHDHSFPFGDTAIATTQTSPVLNCGEFNAEKVLGAYPDAATSLSFDLNQVAEDAFGFLEDPDLGLVVPTGQPAGPR
jgi:hypothetical protein